MNRAIRYAVLTLALLGWWLPDTPARADAERPNVLLIYVDDHVTEAIQHGALTPNIKSLAEDGIYFSRAYSSAPACTPARYGCMTGRYAGRCRGRFLSGGITREGQTWVHWNATTDTDDLIGAKLMRDAGYTTGIIGKIGCVQIRVPDEAKDYKKLAADDPKRKELFLIEQQVARETMDRIGFDFCEAVTISNMASGDQRHNPEFQTKYALEFLEANQGGPFYLHFCPHLMHAPSPLASLKGDPRNLYGTLMDEAPQVQPSRQSVLERVAAAGISEELAPATWLDDSIGALLDKLDALDLRDNTLIFFSQDNGHHGGKGSTYEGGADVLGTWVRWPQGIKQPGRRNDSIVQNIDFIPTMFDACGITPPSDYVLDGLSLMPLLRAETDKLRDAAFIEMGHTRAVVTRDWKYIAFRVPASHQLTPELKEKYRELARIDPTMDPELRVTQIHRQLGGCNTERAEGMTCRPHFFDPDQLYDITQDKDEQTNLASNPEYGPKLKEMQALLRSHMKKAPGTFGEFKTFDEMSDLERAPIEAAAAQNNWTGPSINQKSLDQALKAQGR